MYSESELNYLIGQNVRYYRQLYNLGKNRSGRITQERLAEIVGVSTSLIGNLESESINQGISIYTLWRISHALDIPIGNLFPESYEAEGR